MNGPWYCVIDSTDLRLVYLGKSAPAAAAAVAAKQSNVVAMDHSMGRAETEAAIRAGKLREARNVRAPATNTPPPVEPLADDDSLWEIRRP